MSLIGTCCPNLYKWRQGNCCRAKERKGGRFLTIESCLRTILFWPNIGIWWFTWSFNRIDAQSLKFHRLIIGDCPKEREKKVFGLVAEFCHWFVLLLNSVIELLCCWILSLNRIVAEFCHRNTLLLNSVIELVCCLILSWNYFVAQSFNFDR